VDRKVRARLLDEGLEIVTGLWTGDPLTYDGEHYQLQDFHLGTAPVQRPRVPIWVVGAWPRPRSMRRAARYDGLLCAKVGADGTPGDVTPDDIRAMSEYVAENRAEGAPYDVVYEGRTPGDDPAKAAEAVRPWAEAGVTWWMEEMWSEPNGPDDVRRRIRQGPPRID
jgi:alkanesulfonate monooxygenase SsuD/methylene tetrahydromethanopterin reductase-like flavin-dependent oxidoreductase (luciferase family)